MKVSELTNKKLKQELLELNDLIYGDVCCYRTKDVMWYEMLLREAERRNILVTNKLKFN